MSFVGGKVSCPSARPADSSNTRRLPHSFGVFRLSDCIQPVCEGLRLAALPSSSRGKRKYPLTIKRPAGSISAILGYRN